MGAIFLVILNILTFAFFGIDKFKAIYRRWRIPTYVLMFMALSGGSLGAFIGMKVFQHKTKVACFSKGIEDVN